MKVTITPNPSLDPDQRLELTAGFTAAVQDTPDWSARVHAVAQLFGELVVGGAFIESCPQLQWKVSVVGSVATIALSRMPADASALGAAGRVLLALAPDLPLVSLGVRGQTATRPGRALPALAAALSLQPKARAQPAFAAELDPGTEWLHLEVHRGGAMDMQTATWLDEATRLWADAANAGALSDPSPDFELAAGDAVVYPAAVGADFWSTQVVFHDLSPDAPNALINLFDELSRTKGGLGHVSVT